MRRSRRRGTGRARRPARVGPASLGPAVADAHLHPVPVLLYAGRRGDLADLDRLIPDAGLDGRRQRLPVADVVEQVRVVAAVLEHIERVVAACDPHAEDVARTDLLRRGGVAVAELEEHGEVAVARLVEERLVVGALLP